MAFGKELELMRCCGCHPVWTNQTEDVLGLIEQRDKAMAKCDRLQRRIDDMEKIHAQSETSRVEEITRLHETGRVRNQQIAALTVELQAKCSNPEAPND